jgi:hypothetical protein
MWSLVTGQPLERIIEVSLRKLTTRTSPRIEQPGALVGRATRHPQSIDLARNDIGEPIGNSLEPAPQTFGACSTEDCPVGVPDSGGAARPPVGGRQAVPRYLYELCQIFSLDTAATKHARRSTYGWRENRIAIPPEEVEGSNQ